MMKLNMISWTKLMAVSRITFSRRQLKSLNRKSLTYAFNLNHQHNGETDGIYWNIKLLSSYRNQCQKQFNDKHVPTIFLFVLKEKNCSLSLQTIFCLKRMFLSSYLFLCFYLFILFKEMICVLFSVVAFWNITLFIPCVLVIA